MVSMNPSPVRFVLAGLCLLAVLAAASVRADHSNKFVTLDIDLDIFKYFRAAITEMEVHYFNDRIHTHCNTPEMAVAVRRMFAR